MSSLGHAFFLLRQKGLGFQQVGILRGMLYWENLRFSLSEITLFLHLLQPIRLN